MIVAVRTISWPSFKDKHHEDQNPVPDAKVQLIAGTVAAFQENDENRMSIGQPKLTERIRYALVQVTLALVFKKQKFSGVIMTVTSPAFFKVFVTKTCVHTSLTAHIFSMSLVFHTVCLLLLAQLVGAAKE